MIADAQVDVPGEVLLAEAAAAPRRVHAANPFFERRPGRWKHATFEPGAEDVVETCAGDDHILDALEVVAPDAVAHHHPILGIKKDEAFRDAFDCVANGALRPLDLLDQLFLLGDVTGRSDHAIGASLRVAQSKAMLTRPTPLTGPALVSNIAIETFALPFEMFDESASIPLVILRVKQRCPMLRLGKLMRVDLQVLSHRR